MCDRCGRVFSQLEDFQHFEGVSIKTDASGRRLEQREQMDACSECQIKRPVPELEGKAKKS
jgi:hypothetical protein